MVNICLKDLWFLPHLLLLIHSHHILSICLLNPTLETGYDIHSWERKYYYVYSLYTHTHWHWCDIQKIVNLESRCCRISWILRNLVRRSQISKMNVWMDFFSHDNFKNYHWKHPLVFIYKNILFLRPFYFSFLYFYNYFSF